MRLSPSRWAALGLRARFLSKQVHFGLVFHTEGLVNEKVVRKLQEFGIALRGDFKPTLAVITPLCPQYHIDPLMDRMRREFAPASSEGVERRFGETIGALSRDFEIGYHGHFFELNGGKYSASFNPQTISSQFSRECQYLTSLGHPPWVYAGGWWFISPAMEPLFERFQFRLDTTVNDLLSDSFGRVQQVFRRPLGEPSLLFEKVLEIQSVRSFKNILGKPFDGKRAMFLMLSLHDYDLLDPQLGPALKTVQKLAAKGAILSAGELYDLALGTLKESRRENQC